MAATQDFIGTGRRKSAVARVRLAVGTGKITINRRPFEKYFLTEDQRAAVVQPLKVTDNVTKFDVRANVQGGGPSGQAGAVQIGRAHV